MVRGGSKVLHATPVVVGQDPVKQLAVRRHQPVLPVNHQRLLGRLGEVQGTQLFGCALTHESVDNQLVLGVDVHALVEQELEVAALERVGPGLNLVVVVAVQVQLGVQLGGQRAVQLGENRERRLGLRKQSQEGSDHGAVCGWM